MAETFSHFTIVGKLGQGGMGEVYRAKDSKLGRDVALKLLATAFTSDGERLARFEREAKLLASLNHPHIAAIHGIEEDGGRRALVLEYVAGDDLSVRTARGALRVEDALDVARQITDALEAAHEQGIIHRDLKPANIKITPDGAVKVLDFGLAKALDPTADDDGTTDPSITQSPTVVGSTVPGVILGTAAYMSPEQARGKRVDKRADIWAFGCVLFEMLSGRQAFSGDTVSDTLAAILRADPDWNALPDNVPPAIKTLLGRCLEKNPRLRLRDIGEARILIEAVQSGDVAPVPGSAVEPATRKRRRVGAFILWLFTLLFAAAWIVFMVLFIVTANREGPRVVRALITPKEGSSFSGRSFTSYAYHALSSNGAKLAFIADDMLWVRALSEINAMPIRGTEGATFPFWSTDGRAIGFFADGKLKTVPDQGGPVTVVCDAPQGRGGTWNADNVIVFTPTLRTGLYWVPATGGEPAQFTYTKRPTHSTHRWPRFLPDGIHVLYMAANHTNPKGAQTAIYVTQLDRRGGDENREDKLLVPADSHPVYASGYLLYVRDRNLMARRFDTEALAVSGEPIRIAENAAHHGGSWVGVFDAREDVLTYEGNATPLGSVLVWADASGKPLGAVGGRELYWDINISPDGKSIAIARGNPEPTIYVHEIERGTDSRLVADGTFSRSPVWSPDGSRIAYASIRDNGRLNVYIAPVDRSSPPEPLIVEDVDMIPQSWSPDGEHLLVDYGDPGETEIWVINMVGEPKAEPFVTTRPWVFNATFSPDGNWVAYVSREGGAGIDEVMATPFPGPGSKVQVSSTAGGSPRWGPAGDRMYFEFNSRLFEVAVRSSGPRLEIGSPEGLLTIDSDTSIFVQSGLQLDVAPDGRLLFLAASEEKSEVKAITLVVGWMRELE